MKKHTKEFLTFTQWLRMLGKLAEDQYGFELIAGGTAWRDFYDDSYSPREALDEDTYAGI